MKALIYLRKTQIKNKLNSVYKRIKSNFLYSLYIMIIVAILITLVLCLLPQTNDYLAHNIFQVIDIKELVGFILLFFFFLITIFRGISYSPVLFSDADITLLLLSPIKRENILGFELLKSIITKILVSNLIILLFARLFHQQEINIYTILVGVNIFILITTNLHWLIFISTFWKRVLMLVKRLIYLVFFLTAIEFFLGLLKNKDILFSLTLILKSRIISILLIISNYIGASVFLPNNYILVFVLGISVFLSLYSYKKIKDIDLEEIITQSSLINESMRYFKAGDLVNLKIVGDRIKKRKSSYQGWKIPWYKRGSFSILWKDLSVLQKRETPLWIIEFIVILVGLLLIAFIQSTYFKGMLFGGLLITFNGFFQDNLTKDLYVPFFIKQLPIKARDLSKGYLIIPSCFTTLFLIALIFLFRQHYQFSFIQFFIMVLCSPLVGIFISLTSQMGLLLSFSRNNFFQKRVYARLISFSVIALILLAIFLDGLGVSEYVLIIGFSLLIGVLGILFYNICGLYLYNFLRKESE